MNEIALNSRSESNEFILCSWKRPSTDQAVASTERNSSARVLTSALFLSVIETVAKWFWEHFVNAKHVNHKTVHKIMQNKRKTHTAYFSGHSMTSHFHIIFYELFINVAFVCGRWSAFANIALMLSNDCGRDHSSNWNQLKHSYRFQCAIICCALIVLVSVPVPAKMMFVTWPQNEHKILTKMVVSIQNQMTINIYVHTANGCGPICVFVFVTVSCTLCSAGFKLAGTAEYCLC